MMMSLAFDVDMPEMLGALLPPLPPAANDEFASVIDDVFAPEMAKIIAPVSELGPAERLIVVVTDDSAADAVPYQTWMLSLPLVPFHDCCLRAELSQLTPGVESDETVENEPP